MDIVGLHAEADKQTVRAELVLDRLYHRDRAAAADQRSWASEVALHLQRFPCRLKEFRPRGDFGGRVGAVYPKVQLGVGMLAIQHERLESFHDALGILSGYQAEGNLCPCLCRNRGRDTRSGVAPPHAVNGDCGARPQPLQSGVTALAVKLGKANLIQEPLLIEIIPRRTSLRADILHSVIEARYLDTAVRVLQRAQERHQGVDGIQGRSAIERREYIALGTLQANFHIY